MFRWRDTLTIVGLSFVVLSCSKPKDEKVVNDPATNPPEPPKVAAAQQTATAAPAGPPGTISGVVKFTGKAPVMGPIAGVEKDAVCKTAAPMDNAVLVSKDGGLKDVLVRIIPGGATGGDVPTTPKQLKQEGCMYVPRMVGVVDGQDIEITNADKTMHNVHTTGSTKDINAAQPAGSPALKRPASDDPAMIKVKCDVHPWMTAYIIATDHPYFAVTDENGKFSIPNVPSGTYQVEAWHSEFGDSGGAAKSVTVPAGGSIDPQFTFTGSEPHPN